MAPGLTVCPASPVPKNSGDRGRWVVLPKPALTAHGEDILGEFTDRYLLAGSDTEGH